MNLIGIYSSVVFVGEGFSTGLFRPEKHSDIVGEIDFEHSIMTPVVSQWEFIKSGHRVVISPNRIELGFNGDELLPDSLLELANMITSVLQKLEQPTCNGLGVNLNLTIDISEKNMTGKEFCLNKFIAVPNLNEILQTDDLLANFSKLVFNVKNVRYTVDIEPHAASEGRHLFIKMNGHQDITNECSLDMALGVYADIKQYEISLPDRFLEV